MQFNQAALDEKIKHLDEIKQHYEYVTEIVSKNLGNTYRIEEQKRNWVGGGATPYIVSFGDKKAYLKVKHKDVTVESKLEEEKDFIREPCLFHEYKMLKSAASLGVSVPDVLFYEEYKDFQFLATSYVGDSLGHCLETNTLEETISLWNSLENNVRKLFDNGLVHSDIHEFNIRCKSPTEVVLIDFEECREFRQSCVFEESLDYVGYNKNSSLGDFPLAKEQFYCIHLNSLARMRLVFKDYLAAKTEKYIKECNYDSSNGICLTIDHGKTELTYQSIKNDYISVKGQRNDTDKRPYIIKKLCDIFFESSDFTFIDVGSNNGLFCREISKYYDGKNKAIGLEGFFKFNILARALAFLEDCKNIEYRDFLCGENNFNELQINNSCFVTICSVWHHIQNKAVFLKQLRNSNVEYILFEFAVQNECYNGHSWEKELQDINDVLNFTEQLVIGYSSDYRRPLVLIAKNKFSESQNKKLKKLIKNLEYVPFMRKLESFFYNFIKKVTGKK